MENEYNFFQPEIETVEEFIQRFQVQNAEKIIQVEDDQKKKAMILAQALPVKILTDIQRCIKPKLLTDSTYEEIEEHLIASFGVKKSVIGASVSFLTRKQKAGETIEVYAKSLNDLASHCGYRDCCRNRMLRDAFISGLNNSRLISALITDCENKNFRECVDRAKIHEQVTQDVQDINPGKYHSNYKIDKSSVHQNDTKKNKNIPANYICIRCASVAKHFAKDCFALKLKCNKCSKQGHISRACKSTTNNNSGKHRANNIQENDSDNGLEEVDSSNYIAMYSVKRFEARVNSGNSNPLRQDEAREFKVTS